MRRNDILDMTDEQLRSGVQDMDAAIERLKGSIDPTGISQHLSAKAYREALQMTIDNRSAPRSDDGKVVSFTAYKFKLRKPK